MDYDEMAKGWNTYGADRLALRNEVAEGSLEH